MDPLTLQRYARAATDRERAAIFLKAWKNFDPRRTRLYEVLAKPCRPSPGDILKTELAELLRRKMVKEFEGSLEDVRGTVRFFFKFEDDKGRKRLIAAPFTANGDLPLTEDERPDLPGLEDIEEWIRRTDVAAGLDVQWWYGHFPLPPELERFFVGEIGGRLYVPTTLPTGLAAAPAFAHALLRLIRGNDEDFTFLDYIDNVYVGASGPTARRLQGKIRQLQATFHQRGCALNDIDGPTTDLAVLGLMANLRDKTVRLKESTLRKLEERWLKATSSTATLADAASFIGTVFWATRILGLWLSRHFAFMQHVRLTGAAASAHRADLDAPWRFTPQAHADAELLLQKIRLNTPRSVAKQAPTITVATDSSETAWAWASYEGDIDLIENHAAPHAQHEYGEYPNRTKCRINQLEAYAMVKALEALPIGSRVKLYVDNTSAIGAALKGYSPSQEMNDQVRAIHDLVEERNLRITDILHIPTHINPADKWTRLSQGKHGRGGTVL